MDDILERAPAIVYAARPDGTLSYVSSAWVRFSGVPAESLLDDGWSELVHPADRERVSAAWLHSLASGEPFCEEFRNRDRDGEYRWVTSHAVPSYNEQGAITAWYGTMHGIDERRRTDRRRAILGRLGLAFAESLEFEEVARTVVSAMCEDFADFALVDVLDSDGRLQRIAAESGRLGVEPGALKAVVPPPDADRHPITTVIASSLPIASIAYVPMIAAGERVGVLTFGAANGTGREFSEDDIEDAEEVARRAAVALVNARLYSDLAASEARYRGIIDTAQEGVWIIDGDRRTRYVNTRMTEMLGYSPDELYGRDALAFVAPDDRDTAISTIAQHRRGNGDRGELKLVHRNEQIVWVMVASNPLFDPNGAYAGSLGMFTDITERKATETRYRVIARASDVLSGSLDFGALLGRFADLLVEELADEATIALKPDRAVVRRRTALPATAPSLRMPLRYRNVELGDVTIRTRRPFGRNDVALFEDLAARASIAIENARLYEREHRVAITLQRALLPAVLPEVAGAAFDAVYYPGATEAEIGGDWYDAIALPDGRVVVSIGDVTGRGLTAAVIMGRMRQAIETLATYESSPVRLLDASDAVLKRAHPDAIVTALVAVVDPATRTMTYATAGHPPPLVRSVDGTVRALPGRGLPLGLRDGHEAPATSLVLPADALVLFYTDGLVEATRDIGEGERRLFEALHEDGVAGVRAPAAAIVARMLDDDARDDIAVLTMRLTQVGVAGREWTVRWQFDPRDRRNAVDVREALVETLTNCGRTIDVHAAQLVFGELIGNAVRHAPGRIEVMLTWDEAKCPVLHVLDEGPGFAPRWQLPSFDAESGRGLFLVSRLTEEFSVTKKADRGAHARAVLLRSS